MNQDTLNKIETTVDSITETSNKIADLLESWGAAAGQALRN